MTEFITRSCKAESRYEVIIKTDSEEHYKATEDFARRLIDHAKPQTNGDRIRAMSDNGLAEFLADIFAKESCRRLERESFATAIQIEEIRHFWYCYWAEWLKQPAEE